MGFKRGLGVVVAMLAVAAAGYGAAATLGSVSTEMLGAGSANVVSCDTDGVSSSYTISAGNVTAVTVSGLAGDCDGATLSLTLVDDSDAAIGEASGVSLSLDPQSDVNSVNVPVTPTPGAELVSGIHIAIAGP